MPRGLGRLPFLTRRSRDADLGTAPAAPARTIDPDEAPVGPPLLLPAAIIRQVLYEATELIPTWALPRPITTATLTAAAAPAGGPIVSTGTFTGPGTGAVKRTRKPAPATPASATPATKTRRTAKATDGAASTAAQGAAPKRRRTSRAKDAG